LPPCNLLFDVDSTESLGLRAGTSSAVLSSDVAFHPSHPLVTAESNGKLPHSFDYTPKLHPLLQLLVELPVTHQR